MIRNTSHILFSVVLGSGLLLGIPLAEISSSAQAEEPVDFTRDIRSILSNKCFHCHGPDEAERQGSLRLDTQQGAYAEGDSGLPAITPGDPDNSELLRRITSQDDSERMPPPSSGNPLTEAQQAKFRQWIAQGAPYAGHWAYQVPIRPAVPQVQQTDWPKNDIDHFILSRLEREGLTPQPAAPRELLARRVSLDLIGLPPTPEQVDEFVRDNTSPEAYERLVDRLLASPAYGEHWARMWLDLARYADSAGYADDPARTIWAYRDYVIRAFNNNMPFDEFTREQLAGDLLPHPTDEQLIATAFHRNTMTNNEGGTDDEEFRNAAVVDRVNTTFAVWMGTTMACAQCHTHKFDPITHKDYFQLFALFNNTADADKRDESPLLTYFTPEQKQQKAAWQTELAKVQKKLATPTPELEVAFADWQARFSDPLKWTSMISQTLTSNEQATLTADEQQTITVTPPQPNDWQKTDTYQLRTLPEVASENNSPFTALRLETFPDHPQGHSNFVITQITASIEPQETSQTKIRYVRIELPGKEQILSLAEVEVYSSGQNIALQGSVSQSSTDYAGEAQRAIDGQTDGDYFKTNSVTHTARSTDPWWELDLQNSTAVDSLVLWNRTDGNTGDRLKNYRVIALDENRQPVWEQQFATAPNPQQTITLRPSRSVKFRLATADYTQSGFEPQFVLDEKDPEKRGWAVAGQTDRSHELVLLPEKPFSVGSDEQLVVTIAQQSQYEKHVLRKFRLSLSQENRVQDWAKIPVELRRQLQRTSDASDTPETANLLKYYLAQVAPALQKERQREAQLTKALSNMKPYTTVPVMRRLPEEQHRVTHIQLRGNFMSLGEKVEPGLPAALHPTAGPQFTEREPTRLTLANWLVDEQNPLTARVIANRYWEKIFGLGLVPTSEEFGSQGELPTHPELLDWLATELIRLDWDLKAFVRQLVLTAAYQQSSGVTQELLEVDPDNRLLSRGPRFRLSAEMVRDQALFVSGLLSSKMYGPPVNPPQPQLGLNAAFGGKIDWVESKGEDKFRRGLYTTWRRSNPYPSMAAFDAPNREVCLVRRDRTNTPLQAFVTLNDPVYVEAAQALARRISKHSTELSEQIDYGMRLCVSRSATEREQQRLQELYHQTRTVYEQEPEAALKLATQPLGPLPEGSTAVDLAAWTLLSNVLLNLDEMLMKP